jgi:hypothetical protein
MSVISAGWVPTSATAAHSTSVSVQLGDARRKLQEMTTPGQRDAILAEVHRVQKLTSSSLLDAYQAVFAKMAAGWTPAD